MDRGRSVHPLNVKYSTRERLQYTLEQMMQSDPSFYFAGWNVGIQNIGDVPMSTPGFDQIPPTEGVQPWF